jgi:hypothetical protein
MHGPPEGVHPERKDLTQLPEVGRGNGHRIWRTHSMFWSCSYTYMYHYHVFLFNNWDFPLFDYQCWFPESWQFYRLMMINVLFFPLQNVDFLSLMADIPIVSYHILGFPMVTEWYSYVLVDFPLVSSGESPRVCLQFWPAAGEWQPARLREALGADAAAGLRGMSVDVEFHWCCHDDERWVLP